VRSWFGQPGRRLVEHFRVPVYRQGYALVLSAGLASLLGFVYWIVAARTYAASAVGLNSAVISTMTLVSTVAQLNLVGGLLRFVPDAGRSTVRLVAWSYGVSAALSAVIAVIVLAVAGWLEPALHFLRHGSAFAALFVTCTVVWSVFNLQDAVLTGLRRAGWVPVDNVLFAIAKLVLLIVLASELPRFGIFASWTLGTIISVIVISIVLLARLIPSRVRTSPAPVPLSARLIGRFVAADYVGGLSWTVAITIIPVVITARLGASANAYYSLAWVMTMPLYLVSLNMSNSLVVAIVEDRERIREYSHRVFVQTARLVVPAAVFLAIAAPFLLSLFGEDYADHGSRALRLLALSAIPNVVTTLSTAVWRAERRLSLLIWVRLVQFGTVLVLSIALLGPAGITGPAIAWLGVQAIGAAILLYRFPGLLTGARSRPRRSVGAVRILRNFAADIGVLALTRAVRERPRKQQRREGIAEAVPQVLEVVADASGDLSALNWDASELPPSLSDKLVVLVGPPGEPPRVVIKLAESDGAARALTREAEVLTMLAADPRLGAWHRLAPSIVATGTVDGKPFTAETVLPGVAASGVIADAAALPVWLGPIADALGELHRCTAEQIEVGEPLAEAWVEEPIARLERHTQVGGRADPWRLRALDQLRSELRWALVGRCLEASWVHGDYVPGNVLLDVPAGAVSGIIDWELGSCPDLPALDRMQLILSTRMLVRRREFGEIVTEALDGQFSELEHAVLMPGPAEGDQLPLRSIVLLAWLRHTAGMLGKAPRYADNRLWRVSNIDAGLAALA
jgi:O-antigen/teichoic acid export membrane protein